MISAHVRLPAATLARRLAARAAHFATEARRRTLPRDSRALWPDLFPDPWKD